MVSRNYVRVTMGSQPSHAVDLRKLNDFCSNINYLLPWPSE